MKLEKKIGLIGSLCVFLLGVSSCFKSEQFPEEPAISNPEVTVFSDSAKVSFDFTDGDADLGLAPQDTSGVFAPDSFYYYNIYLNYFEKKDNGGWQPGLDLNNDPVVFAYRIKPIEVSENTEGISGRIDITLEPTFKNDLSPDSDTIRYQITLIDRALNHSNVLETAAVISQ